MELGYADPDGFAKWLVGYGSDVVVLEPTEIRDAVIRRLTGLVDHAAAAASGAAS